MNRKQIVLAVVVLFATACVAFLSGVNVRGQLESTPSPAASSTALPSNPIDDAPPCVKVLASDEKYDKPCVMGGGHTGKWECARNRIDVWCNTTAGSIPRSKEHCIFTGEREFCNHLDDNCDGRIDEGFDLWGDDRNCGNCGNVCEAGTMCYEGKCQEKTDPHLVDYDPTAPR